jgi:asparagine synthase (glutamine-hydrolysing)
LTRLCNDLKEAIRSATQNEQCDAILLSGGLDSTIITSIRKPEYSITVGFGADAYDLKYAKAASRKFVKKQIVRILSTQEVLALIDDIIVSLKTFDPITIRNAVVPYAGLEIAGLSGLTNVYSGDGADELFAGYNFLTKLIDDSYLLHKELSRLRTIMTFPTFKIGDKLNVKVVAPFLNENVRRISASIPMANLISMHNNRVWGKTVLRHCYGKEIGEEFSWRIKQAQEEGAGLTKIREILGNRITDSSFNEEVKEAKRQGIIVRDKEHLHYYKRFIRNFTFDEIKVCPELKCSGCGSCVSFLSNYCRLCGLYPVAERTANM